MAFVCLSLSMFETRHFTIQTVSHISVRANQLIFKPPPPVGAGGGYMFSGRPSVPLSVRASVRP